MGGAAVGVGLMAAVQSPVSVPGFPSNNNKAKKKHEHNHNHQANPTSAKLAEQAKPYWHNGVPMHWMLDWATPFPLYAKDAKGATLPDVDGHHYDDFCLGATG